MDVNSPEAALWSENMKLKSENENLRLVLKETSDALLTVAPLGGSECFRKIGDEFYADPEFFKRRIQELHESRHEAIKASIRAGRA